MRRFKIAAFGIAEDLSDSSISYQSLMGRPPERINFIPANSKNAPTGRLSHVEHTCSAPQNEAHINPFRFPA
jgi:hypothetical protein